MKKRILLVLLSSMLLHASPAQTILQSVSLVPGWNAVYLMVEPNPAGLDTLLAGKPVESVRRWNPSPSGYFEIDPQTPVSMSGNWQIWFPEGSEFRDLSDLAQLSAGSTYLIQASGSTTVQVSGIPVLCSANWQAGQNFGGVPVPVSAPTFTKFFSFDSAISTSFASGGELYKVLPDASVQRIFQPATEKPARGTAYWIKSTTTHPYSGALEVGLSSSKGWLDFGGSLFASTMTIKNTTTVNQTARLELTGTIPLSRVVPFWDGTVSRTEYIPLTGTVSSNLAPGQVWSVRLTPTATALATASEGATFGGVLNISDVGGTMLQQIGVACVKKGDLSSSPTGLWVGEVAVEKVNRAVTTMDQTWDSEQLIPASDVFSFRLLIHVDELGDVRLLQRVLVASRQNNTGETVHELLTDESAVEPYRRRYPDAAIKRISSANIPMMNPQLLTGLFGGSNVCSGTVSLSYDDPVNPFKHRYAPMHDNLEERNGTFVKREEGVESYSINRAISLSFFATDPEELEVRWGSTVVGGIYRETISGLHRPMKVEGEFRLRKVSDVATLGAAN